MLSKLKDFCFTTNPLNELDCDSKKWIKRNYLFKIGNKAANNSSYFPLQEA